MENEVYFHITYNCCTIYRVFKVSRILFEIIASNYYRYSTNLYTEYYSYFIY